MLAKEGGRAEVRASKRRETHVKHSGPMPSVTRAATSSGRSGFRQRNDASCGATSRMPAARSIRRAGSFPQDCSNVSWKLVSPSGLKSLSDEERKALIREEFRKGLAARAWWLQEMISAQTLPMRYGKE